MGVAVALVMAAPEVATADDAVVLAALDAGAAWWKSSSQSTISG